MSSGKFYHRHRRPNDQVTYSTDPDFHLNKKKGSEELRRLRKRGINSRIVAESASAVGTPASVAPAETPISDDDDDDEDDIPLAARATRHSQPPVNPIRILSDLSDPDSGTEEGGNLVVKKDTKRRPVTSASNSSLSPPPPISTGLPEVKELTPTPTEPEKSAVANPTSPTLATTEPASTPSVPPVSSPVTNGARPSLTRKSTAPHVLAVSLLCVPQCMTFMY